ncbi:TonB-dependent receptor [Sphingobium jiangsuense]|uniref:Iron complex outermembrane receptor protein n=1 Tax=Sphingobium jiangsuense TaxID=870476 RepID=A0A7W6FPK0_9SPHN|nr:TonB-dependent receptor [Sphingobium jiangsuense]MBB3925963.1 iron complex outermembrane receptor protein [Sphingobium jiangsuense]GLS98897.1 TonB-dependent receptor [Sphingobium jiangsuense]
MRNRNIWIAGASLWALSTAPGWAQSAPEAGAAQADMGDTIVVTARRREENLQDVPVAITALSAAALESRGIERSDDLQFSVPSLRIAPQISATTPNFIIRGQGRPLFSGALPSVVTYFADVPLPQDGSIVPLFDLSSVQVLKGPQGTLFGRNTTGGAILLSPTQPDLDKVEGYVEAGAGNYDAYTLAGAVNVPVVPGKLAIRAAGELARRDGFVRNLGGGANLGNRHTDSVRVSVLARPTDTLQNLFIFDWTNIDENGAAVVPTAVFTDGAGNPLGNAATAANRPYFFGGTLADDIRLQLDQVKAAGVMVANPSIDDGYVRGKVWGIVNTTSLDIGAITLKNIFGYRKATIYNRFDIDGLPVALNDQINADGAFPQVAIDAFSNEFQIAGTLFDKQLEFVLGAFYLNEGPTGESGTQALQFYRTGSAAPVVQNIYIRNKSKALFGQATYHFRGALEGLNLTAGYRRTWDEREFCVMQQVASRGPDACAGITRGTKFDAPSYTLSIDYKLSDEILLYGAHRRGYRGGGVNTNVPVGLIEGIYRPEVVNDYEGGVKTNWAFGGVRGHFNFAYYRANISDFQASSVVALPLPGGGTLNSSIVANAAKAHTEGFEAELVVIPVRGLTLSANYDHFNGAFDEFVGPSNFPVGSLLDFKFNTPNDTLNLNASYQMDLPSGWGETLGFTVNYYWRGDTLISTAASVPNAITTEPSFDTVDLRLDWKRVADTGLDLSLFVRNVGDTRYRTGMSSSAAAFTLATSYYGEPRTYGLKLRYAF